MDKRMIGRYELIDGKSAKYWKCELTDEPGIYLTSWGKISSQKPQGVLSVESEEAEKRVRDKLKKGYKKVD